MRLSDDKINHITHLSLTGLLDKKAITLLTDESAVRKEIKRLIVKGLKLAEDIDTAVKKKLQSYSKKIPEGTPEWDVLYQRFFQEESSKKGLG